MKFFPLLLMLFLPGISNAQAKLKTNADENTLLWEISGKGLVTPSYLFGTFICFVKKILNSVPL